MKIADIYTNKECPISFEIFPPKGDLTREVAHQVASDLAKLEPDFMSVTYSAGGSGNSQATAEIAQMIQDEFGVPSMAHLTCINMTESDLERSVADIKSKGIENVLALRGDIPEGARPLSDFRYAKDIIERLIESDLCVGAAAYPEGHIDCDNAQTNIEHLKQKQDAGAAFFVTQIVFDNRYFYQFWEDAQKAGITVPISCGIMPFLSKAQIQRMVFMCGASLPSPVIKLLAKYEDSPEDLKKAGIEYASAQLCDLAEHGVDGLHIYTMNNPAIAQANVAALRTL